jgi:cell division protein FtsL
MNRISALVWVLLVVFAGFATFKAKYAVQDLEDQLHRVQKQTIAERQEIRVLNAEWTYLNQPERLAGLNQRFLGLAPITTRQLESRIEDIPLRPPPAPEMVVAAAPKLAPPPPATPPPATPVPRTAPSRPPVVAATFTPAAAAPPLRLAKAGPASFGSLNALIAQIAEAR